MLWKLLPITGHVWPNTLTSILKNGSSYYDWLMCERTMDGYIPLVKYDVEYIEALSIQWRKGTNMRNSYLKYCYMMSCQNGKFNSFMIILNLNWHFKFDLRRTVADTQC